MYIAVLNAVYLSVYLALTLLVGRALARNGRLILADAFPGDAALARSVSRLLMAGFYLLNAGAMAASLQFLRNGEAGLLGVQVVADRIGRAVLVLGIVHFFTLYMFHRLGRRRGERSGNGRPHPTPGWNPESAPLGKVLD